MNIPESRTMDHMDMYDPLIYAVRSNNTVFHFGNWTEITLQFRTERGGAMKDAYFLSVNGL